MLLVPEFSAVNDFAGTNVENKFLGFTEADFAVFELEEFAERMPSLRAHIKPKLVQLGEILPEALSQIVGETLYPHVAQHLRRTVNPPVETWVAFARTKRAYKPSVHLRVGISRERVRVTVFVEDYADEKLLFAAHLRRHAQTLAEHACLYPQIVGYETPNEILTEANLIRFADRMERVKGQHAIFGIGLTRAETIEAGANLPEKIVAFARILLPFYRVERESL